jgi:hypothetical protein
VHWPSDLGLVLSKKPTRVAISLPTHLRMEAVPVFETLCFLARRMPDDGQRPETQQLRVSCTIVRSIMYSIPTLPYGADFGVISSTAIAVVHLH